jgi:hypothetical protein
MTKARPQALHLALVALALGISVTALGCTEKSTDPGTGDGGRGGTDDTEGSGGSQADPNAFGLPLELPNLLSDYEIYDDLSAGEFSAQVFVYTPRFPLWTNGSEKQRGIYLPPGTEIKVSGDKFEFPLGTVFIKTFSYPVQAVGEQRVETRLIQKTDDGFDYAVYQWNEAGDDATLLDLARTTTVDVSTSAGKLSHTIPSRLNCRSCHESQSTTILGFVPLQLDVNDQLRDLADQAIFDRELMRPAPINGASDLEKRVLGYFVGNCTHCHNGEDGPASAFSLKPADALNNIVDQRATSELVSGYRVVSGSPEQSGLYLALSRDDAEGTAQAMPPLGVDRRDEQALTFVKTWIESLPITERTPDLGLGGSSSK